MLDRSGQLITRDEIRGILWPDSNVDFDHSLDVLVGRLRTTLGDNSRKRSIHSDRPKKSYRFVAQVRPERRDSDTSTSVNRTSSFVQYASVTVLAALIALLVAHTRYQGFVPPHTIAGL